MECSNHGTNSMARWVLLFLVGLGWAAPSALAQPDEDSRGVVAGQTPTPIGGRLVVATIGIDNYRHWQKLDNAVSDAVGIQNALVEKAGFTPAIEPLLEEEATKSAIMSFVQDRLHQALEPDDRLVLFFAGHGHTRSNRVGDQEVETGYLVPVDAPVGTEEEWSSYISIKEFLDAANLLPARHVLVILDACHSGFALGQSIRKTRGAKTYEDVLTSKISRRVITSAQRDQLASDNGPLPKHSLFTGSLVDGLAWGKIDMDGNGLVTSSEIGLYLQQVVGQSTNSRQTPDYGAFGLDDRGELVISLTNQSFGSLVARAMSALQHGLYAELSDLTEELHVLRPSSPETLYMRYRERLLATDVDGALEAVSSLADLTIEPGRIPLSSEEIWDLSNVLPYWKPLLELPENPTDLRVKVVFGSGKNAEPVELGQRLAYSVPADTRFYLNIENMTNQTRFVYALLITEAGRIRPLRIWEQPFHIFNGMQDGETLNTLPLLMHSVTGIEELRLIASATPIEVLLLPPDPKSRGFMSLGEESLERIAQSRRNTVRLVPAPSDRGNSR